MERQKVLFKVSQRVTAASCELKGPYSGIGEAMRRLKTWMDSKAIEQSGYPFCLFYDNPFERPAEELRSEACIPVARRFQPEGEFKVKEFGAVQVAETRHTGPADEFGKTYGPFLEGLLRDGYRILGPAREYFMSVADVRGPGSGFLIQQPVAKS